MIFFRFTIASIFAALLLTVPSFVNAVSDSDSIDTYHCANCYETCGSWLFDFQCKLDKAFCLSTVALVGGILLAGTAGCKIEHKENYEEANSLIQQANDLLVEKKLFSQTFVKSVNVFFCKIPSDGLSPTNSTVLIKAKFSTSPALEVARLLSREYYHTYQHRQIGTDNLYCQYIESSLISFSGNPIEKEADEFQQDAAMCLFDNEGCPNAPLI